MGNDFDWVTARSECSLPAIFERLRLQLQEDIDKRNAMDSRNDYRLVSNNNRVSVARQIEPSFSESVIFVLNPSSIDVVDRNGNVLLKATPTLNDEGECRLKINGQTQERELWHLRKMALEELFFRTY